MVEYKPPKHFAATESIQSVRRYVHMYLSCALNVEENYPDVCTCVWYLQENNLTKIHSHNLKLVFCMNHPDVHMYIQEDWLDRPIHIDVNTSLAVRVNGGAWHGRARYGHDGGRSVGELVLHHRADLSKLKQTRFDSIPGTNTYLHATKTNAAYNNMLIAKVDWV